VPGPDGLHVSGFQHNGRHDSCERVALTTLRCKRASTPHTTTLPICESCDKAWRAASELLI
jgi:hypothetical protein